MKCIKSIIYKYRLKKRKISKLNGKHKTKKIIIISLFIIFSIISYIYPKNESNNLKLAICTLVRKENLYINEFIDYYIKLGFDHIYIYDINRPNTEKISDVINEKYEDYITIYENISNYIPNQKIGYIHCYKNNKNKYDWIFMIDIDEYLVIKKNLIIKRNTLKEYLSAKVFNKCDFIKIHWVQPTDNNLLHYEARPLLERFKGPYFEDTHIKTLVRRGIKNLIYDIHSPSSFPKNCIICNNAGKLLKFDKKIT